MLLTVKNYFRVCPCFRSNPERLDALEDHFLQAISRSKNGLDKFSAVNVICHKVN